MNKYEDLKRHCANLEVEIRELKEEREIVGIKVRNVKSGKLGVILKKWANGQISVLESIEPYTIRVYDNFDELETTI